MTNDQARAIEILVANGADKAFRASDLSEAERGLYDADDEIIAYGVMRNTNVEGWYFAGYANEIVREHDAS